MESKNLPNSNLADAQEIICHFDGQDIEVGLDDNGRVFFASSYVGKTVDGIIGNVTIFVTLCEDGTYSIVENFEAIDSSTMDHYKEGLAQRAQSMPRPIGDSPEIIEQQRGWDAQHTLLQDNPSTRYPRPLRHIEIVNCFINGASHEYFKVNHQPMVDEDLSMAFDAADAYADMNPMATIEQAHAQGREYASDWFLPISE